MRRSISQEFMIFLGEKMSDKSVEALREERLALRREICTLARVKEAVELDDFGIIKLINTMMACVYRFRFDPPVPMNEIDDLENRTSQISFMSTGTEELLGYAPEYFLGRDGKVMLDRIHVDDSPHMFTALKKSMRNKEMCRLSYRIRSFSGEYRWIWERCVGSYNDKGELTHAQGLMTDIGEQHRQAYQLRRDLTLHHIPAGDRYKFDNIIGKSEAMKKVYSAILDSCEGNSHIVLYGESGTGKDLVARSIHSLSDRAEHAFIPVNCGAIPDYLFESEFFGYRRGAFTGAIRDKKGFMDLADKGTLFLDEIGEISLSNQAKLLRAVEDGGFTPLGSNEFRRPNVRIIAATNRDLAEEVRKGKFRADLYYRIHVIPINIPPLRERGEDIFLLTDYFQEQILGQGVKKLPISVFAAFEKYSWPGNIRELQNVIQRYLTTGELGIPSDTRFGDETCTLCTLKADKLETAVTQFESQYIRAALEATHWNRTAAAQRLGISRKTLFRKMKKCGID